MIRGITIRGKHYKTCKEAAHEIGCTVGAIHGARRDGRLDTVGLKPQSRPNAPITIRGVTYPSRNEAAKALGVSLSTIESSNRRGGLDSVGLGYGHWYHCKALGKEWRGGKRVAREFGISHKTLYGYMADGLLVQGHHIEKGRLEDVDH